MKLVTPILLVLLAISVGYIWLNKSEPNYEYLKTEHTRIRTELKALGETLKTQDYEINRLKKEMSKSDSIILNATEPELDRLFSTFFDRTRFRPLLLE